MVASLSDLAMLGLTERNQFTKTNKKETSEIFRGLFFYILLIGKLLKNDRMSGSNFGTSFSTRKAS
ncbi:hypothetical protein SLCC85_20375 [Listeria monocytogenes]|nr:hypothetical protein SLCC85_20375 [Listeria monocytogenes]